MSSDKVRHAGKVHTVCVYCGSSDGADPAYTEIVRRLGHLLANEGFDVVYGGGAVGLMGLLADAVLETGGRVVGVRPNTLFAYEPPHLGLTKMHEVETLAERKRIMYRLADAFVVLPGGLGTLDELCDALALAQLGVHQKRIVLVDVKEFWSPFVAFLDRAARAGFIKARDLGSLRKTDTAEGAIAALA